MSDEVTVDLTGEEWREYCYKERVYRIDNPVSLTYRKSRSRHIVTDANGIKHYLIKPGKHGVVLRWKPRAPVKSDDASEKSWHLTSVYERASITQVLS